MPSTNASIALPSERAGIAMTICQNELFEATALTGFAASRARKRGHETCRRALLLTVSLMAASAVAGCSYQGPIKHDFNTRPSPPPRRYRSAWASFSPASS